MKHIMLDLETLSAQTDAAIVSIGAVKFSPNGADDEATMRDQDRCLDIRIDLDSAMAHGHVSGSTLQWWFKQDAMAIHKTFSDPNNKPMSLRDAMDAFYDFSQGCVYLWGNGANFDNPIIRNAWSKVSQADFPIAYNKDLCYRTVKELVPVGKMPMIPKCGTAHNALDDAIYQARHLQAMYGVMEW